MSSQRSAANKVFSVLTCPPVALLSLGGAWCFLQVAGHAALAGKNTFAYIASSYLVVIYAMPMAAWLVDRIRWWRKKRAGGSRPGKPVALLVTCLWLAPPLLCEAYLLHVRRLYDHAFSITGDTARRRQLFEQAIEADCAAFGPQERRTALALYARRFMNSGRTFPESEWAWRQVYESRPAVAPESDVVTMQALEFLGVLCLKQRKFSQSEDFSLQFLRMSQMRLAQPGLDSAERRMLMDGRVGAYQNLSVAYTQQGDNAKAEAALAEAIRSNESQFGRRHAMPFVDRLVDLYVSEGKLKEAEPLARSCVEFRQEELELARDSSNSPDDAGHAAVVSEAELFARACNRYANILRMLKRPDEAARYEAMATAAPSAPPEKRDQR